MVDMEDDDIDDSPEETYGEATSGDDANERRVQNMKKLTPGHGEGFNIVVVNEFARDVDDELELAGHYDTWEEATEARERLLDDSTGDEQRIYIYGDDSPELDDDAETERQMALIDEDPEAVDSEPPTNGLRVFSRS